MLGIKKINPKYGNSKPLSKYTASYPTKPLITASDVEVEELCDRPKRQSAGSDKMGGKTNTLNEKLLIFCVQQILKLLSQTKIAIIPSFTSATASPGLRQSPPQSILI
jgi:hypothetical protein